MGLREKYSATKVAVLKNKIKEEDASLSSRSDFLSIEPGANKFRIFPKHPGEEQYYQTRVVHWITVEDEEGEEKRKTVPNSRVHGGTKFDIIEEYVKSCKAKYADSDDEDAAEKLSKLVSWNQGLLPSTSWIMYAKKVEKESSEFGFLEIKKMVRDGMNKEATVEDADDPIEIDPFTDPDEGRAIIITYTPKKKGQKAKYEVTLAKKPTALTEEELEDFDSIKSLTEIYRNNYNLQNFELALEGLKFFDEENDMDVFESEEFEEIKEKVRKQYSKKSTTSADLKKKRIDDDDDEDDTPKKKKKVVIDDDEDDEDEKPEKKHKKIVLDDDDEDEVPKKKKKVIVEDDDDDDDDEIPKKKVIEGDDEDDTPKKKKTGEKKMTLSDIKNRLNKTNKDDDDDEEDDEEDEDETPKKKKKKIVLDDDDD